MWLFWLFIAIPIIEIALFIQVGGLIGLLPTLALVLLSAVVGTALMRSQGAKAWIEIQQSFNELRDPTAPIAHGAMILLAGALLVTPGFFTDTLGILLLIPAFRSWAMRQIGKRVQVTRVGMGPMGQRPREPHRPPYDDGVIDADYVVEPDDLPQVPTRSDSRPDSRPGTRPGNRPPSGWTQH